MTSRRTVLKAAAWLSTSAAMPVSFAAPEPGSLLILGGTGFIGPHLTEEALRRGWKVTHFNRGKHEPGGVAGVETLIGDRAGKLDALRGRTWDAVIDDTGYVPRYVKMSAELLAPSVHYCLYISSISAYASFATPNDVHSPLGKLADPETDKVTNDTYGPMKALCEQYSAAAFKDRMSIVRPGYVVGPLDPTDRFTYWPVRVSRGGEMLAPGTPGDPIQYIDVRDLTAFMMTLVEARTNGIFNAVTPPGEVTMGGLITAGQRASPKAGTKVTWVSQDFIEAHSKPVELNLPIWVPPRGDFAGAAHTSMEASRQAGLRSRELEVTVRDTLAWFQSLPEERRSKLHAGLDPATETDTLKAWHTEQSQRPA
ncbi:MAG TPA: NAD-dependent epimerase/dehydratase family protein [Steroidobacteraceae bacterium]|nr:NAD-dependent epimerase/dehydratase family protein [Steroidobacteraceae bacterium]